MHQGHDTFSGRGVTDLALRKHTVYHHRSLANIVRINCYHVYKRPSVLASIHEQVFEALAITDLAEKESMRLAVSA